MGLIDDAESMDTDALALHQQSAWETQRRYLAQKSVFYQELWAGQEPPVGLARIAELPLSDKEQLRKSQRDHPPFGNYLAAESGRVNRLHRTSGTTGQAMNLALSALDCEITEVVGGRAQRAAGLTSDHTVVHCLNYQMWMGGLTDHLTLERTGATVVPFGVGNTAGLIRTITEVGIDAISCTPSYPAVIAQVLAHEFPGVEPADLGLKLGLFGGEPGLDDPELRRRIRNGWGMEPRNANYGVSDVFCNFAGQCEHDTRLHFVAGDVLYPELIDPRTEQPLPLEAGGHGELVLTHLARECQPLVRFRTGDIISVDDTEPCGCGRTGMRFRVVGRSDDMVVVRGINVFPTMVAAVISRFAELSGDYRVVLDEAPPYDVLPVDVELAPGRGGGDEVEPVAIAHDIGRAIKLSIGVTAAVTVHPAGSFDLTEGKTKRLIRKHR